MNVTGNHWNAIGSYSGENNTSGSNWIAIWYESAKYYSGGTTAAASFSSGVYLGTRAKVGATGAQNEVVVGYEAEGIGSNSVVLGNDSITTTALKGNVGIGTTSPTANFHVTGSSSSGNLPIAKIESTGNISYLKFFNSSTGTGASDGTYIGMNGGTAYLMNKEAGNLYLGTGNDFNLTLQNGGRVGIGTTSPSNLLDVVGSNAEIIINDTSSSPKLRLRENGSTAAFIQTYLGNLDLVSSGDLNLYSNNTQRVTIKETTGNVGIGTTSPNAKLEVGHGDLNIGSVLSTVGALSNKLNFWGYTAGQGVCASIGSYRGNNYVSGGLIFETGELSTSEKMRITPNGNVGIGTTAPTSILHLKSDTSTLTLESSDTTLNPDQVWAFLDFKQNDGSQTPVGSVANISAVAKAGNTNFGNLLFQTKSRPADTYNDTLFLSSSGNVGIGTTGPSEKLHVFDTAVVVKIEGNGVTSANLKFKTNETDRWNLNVPSGSTDLRFTTGSSDTLTLKSSGNVGIGTTSPSAKLHVVRTIDADGSLEDNLQLKVENTIEDRPSGIEFRSKRSASASDSAAIVYTTTTATTNTRQIHLIPEIGVSGDLSNSSLIAKAGGQVKVGNSTYAAQALEISGTSVRLDSGPGGDFTFEHPRNGNVFFQVNNQTTLTLDKNNGGKVGIGTTAPTTKLQVNGDVRIYDENELYFGGTGSVPNWEMTASGSDLIVNDTGTNVGSVLFNNDEGVALPRLTTTEINAISSPTQGLMAYNTTLNTICFYNGSSWQKVSHANM